MAAKTRSTEGASPAPSATKDVPVTTTVEAISQPVQLDATQLIEALQNVQSASNDVPVIVRPGREEQQEKMDAMIAKDGIPRVLVPREVKEQGPHGPSTMVYLIVAGMIPPGTDRNAPPQNSTKGFTRRRD